MPRKVIKELPTDTEYEPEPQKIIVEEVKPKQARKKKIVEVDIQLEPEKQEVKTKVNKVGTKEQVFNGEALFTPSGLKRDDLIINNKNKVVSLKKSLLAKQNFKRQ